MGGLKVHTIVFAIISITDAKFFLLRHGPPFEIPSRKSLDLLNWCEMVQRVDHFTPTDARTWKMRFLNNSEFFAPGGPIFIFLGGDWEISDGFIMSGQMFDMAREHKGYMFYIEHRNYGKSYVLEDFSTNSLKYHSVEQALADIAYFITNQKKEIEFKNSKVVVVGGSYSATLATWVRFKYPYLVDIAYASSAPLLAVEDFYQYLEVVSTHIADSCKTCWNVIRDGIIQIEEKLETANGILEVSEKFKSCKLLNTQEPERSSFFSNIISIWMGFVQYAKPGDINRECNILLNYTGSSMEKLGAYTHKKLKGCMGNYNEFLSNYIPTNLSTNAERQWMYQTCTEFGFFQTTSSLNQPFGRNIKLEFHHRICNDTFGEEFTPEVTRAGIRKTNFMYGALNPKVTRVVSVHGTVDPWHTLGLLESLSSETPVIVIPGASHAADLASESSDDFPMLLSAKRTVKKIIGDWLKC